MSRQLKGSQVGLHFDHSSVPVTQHERSATATASTISGPHTPVDVEYMLTSQ